MPILKIKNHETNYTVISNELLQSDLSLSAKGLLCFMLSCSQEWKFSIAGLSSATGATEYLIIKHLKELEEKGYHKKEAIKENGKIVEWVYYISEKPDLNLPDLKFSHLVDLGNKKEEIKKETKTKKEKSQNLFKKCSEVIYDKFTDQDIIDALHKYLSVRIKVGLTKEQWISITEELFNIADTKEEALSIIDVAYKGGYRKLYAHKQNKATNKYVDNIIQTEKTDSGRLMDEYREEFSMIPVRLRPKFEDWLKERNNKNA